MSPHATIRAFNCQKGISDTELSIWDEEVGREPLEIMANGTGTLEIRLYNHPGPGGDLRKNIASS